VENTLGRTKRREGVLNMLCSSTTRCDLVLPIPKNTPHITHTYILTKHKTAGLATFSHDLRRDYWSSWLLLKLPKKYLSTFKARSSLCPFSKQKNLLSALSNLCICLLYIQRRSICLV